MRPARTGSQTNQFEIIQPFDLADLFDLPREEIAFLAIAPIRFPAGWAEAWRTRLGPMELTITEAALITGRQPKTINKWCASKRGAAPLLLHRRAGQRDIRIAPAALLECLKKMAAGTPAPVVMETPAQRARRFAADRLRALAMCGQSRPKKRRAQGPQA